MRKLLLIFVLAPPLLLGQFMKKGDTAANSKKLAGKPVCTATVTTNCVPNADASGNVSIGATVHDAAAAEPACNASNRGHLVRVNGAPGVADTYRQCVKKADNTYAWASLGVTGAGSGDMEAATYDPAGKAAQVLATSDLDTDGTLAANSDAKLATQKAVKTYADTKVAPDNPRLVAVGKTPMATDTAVADAQIPAKYKTRTCEIHIWGSGESQVLQDTDDEAASCYNDFGAQETVTAVRCWANAGSPTVTPIVTGGAANSILSGALTCGTGAWANGTLQGTPALAAAGTIDANITAAGGTATNIRIVVTLTR